MNTPSTKSLIDIERRTLTIVKLGGSLLDLEDLVDSLIVAIADLELPVVMTGGGPPADLVRQWNECGLISHREAHQLAVAAMSLNALQLAHTDTRLALVGSRSEAMEASTCGQIAILDIARVLPVEQSERRGLPSIPESWDATSDSIAAWLARAWHAELRLLKSASPGTRPDHCVDAWFNRASQGLSTLTWVNLRASVPEVSCLPLPLTVVGN